LNSVPWKFARDPGELGINRLRGIAARKREAKLTSLGQSFPRVFQDKNGSVVHEVPGANDVALHAGFVVG
jgi:hypothetical protein